MTNLRPAWLEHAQLLLEAARSHFERSYFGETIVASYFSMFAAMKSVATSAGFLSRRHKALWNDLRHELGKRDLAAQLQRTHDARLLYHYQAYCPTNEEARAHLKIAESFIRSIGKGI
jgi:uncharacterized protein (UPF0332 family)